MTRAGAYGPGMRITYPVLRMNWDCCADSLLEEVARIPGVTRICVAAAGDGSTVTVSSELEVALADLRAALARSGYELAGGRPVASDAAPPGGKEPRPVNRPVGSGWHLSRCPSPRRQPRKEEDS